MHGSCGGCDGSDFNPRAPCGARLLLRAVDHLLQDFNPRAPCGARPVTLYCSKGFVRFQSSRPVRGATLGKPGKHRVQSNFNPRAPCGARLQSLNQKVTFLEISILAPRAGRDLKRFKNVLILLLISILAPRAGRDGETELIQNMTYQISILAPRAGRDTPSTATMRRTPLNFNPRAPCGARQQKCTNFLAFFAINSQSKIEIQRPAQAGRAIYTFMQTAMPVKPSANLLSIGCSLAVRTISSVYLPANKFSCSRNARSSFRTAFPDSKTANYRAWDP